MKFLVYGLSNGWGGVEAIVMSMVQRLASVHKFDIVVGNDECQYEGRFINSNVRFLHMPSWGHDRKGFVRAVGDQLRKETYDFVWVNGCIMSNKDIIAVTRKNSSAKIITHSHGSSFEENNIVKRFILLSLHYLNRTYYLRKVDVPCMCSYRSGLWFYGKDFLLHHNVNMINNGVELESFLYDESIRKQYRKVLGLTDEVALFHAGRLTEVKNQQYLLKIMHQLQKEERKYKLFIAGEGELEQELKEKSKILGVDENVIFLGRRNDVGKLYQAMDVFLLPSLHEGFPVTLTEAQAAGLFCVVSDSVSNETDLTGMVDYLSIEDSAILKWGEVINCFNFNTKNRRAIGEKVRNNGFDVKDVCELFDNLLKRFK